MSFKNRLNRRLKAPDAGEEIDEQRKLVRVADIMAQPVHTTTRHKTVEDVRRMLSSKGVHCAPVVDDAKHAVGIVTSADLLGGIDDRTLVGNVMTKNVYTIPQYAGIHEAARLMRNHHIHHVVVTHEKVVVGILSTFDILRLVEDRRFVPKNASTPAKKKKKASKRKGDGTRP